MYENLDIIFYSDTIRDGVVDFLESEDHPRFKSIYKGVVFIMQMNENNEIEITPEDEGNHKTLITELKDRLK